MLLEVAQLMPKRSLHGIMRSDMHSQSAGPAQYPHTKASISQQEYSKPDVKRIFPEYFMGSTERLSQYGSDLSLVQLVKMNCFISGPQMPGLRGKKKCKENSVYEFRLSCS